MTVIDLAITLQVSEDDKDLEPYRPETRRGGSKRAGASAVKTAATAPSGLPSGRTGRHHRWHEHSAAAMLIGQQTPGAPSPHHVADRLHGCGLPAGFTMRDNIGSGCSYPAPVRHQRYRPLV